MRNTSVRHALVRPARNGPVEPSVADLVANYERKNCATCRRYDGNHIALVCFPPTNAVCHDDFLVSCPELPIPAPSVTATKATMISSSRRLNRKRGAGLKRIARAVKVRTRSQCDSHSSHRPFRRVETLIPKKLGRSPNNRVKARGIKWQRHSICSRYLVGFTLAK